MTNNAELPLQLYKTNLGLQVKLVKLAQENSQQWLDFANRLVNDGIAESNAEAEELLRTEDWQKLATLPAEAFWRQVQQRFGDTQAVAQIAVSAQTAFAQGLQEAIQAWQKETARALGGLTPAATLGNAAWPDLFKAWAPWLPAGEPTEAAASTRSRKGAK